MSRARSRRYAALITDVDGTLTDDERRLHVEPIELLARLVRREIPVILATGNVLPIALGLHRSLALEGPIVAENGGVIWWRDGTTDRVERLADRAVAVRAYRSLRRAGLPVRRLFTDRWRESEVALEAGPSLSRIQRILRGGPAYAESSGFAIHLMERGQGKLPGVRRALERLNVPLEDCVAIGDGDNDAALLRSVGFGISFPDASARARRAARYLTRRTGADGFVEGIRASGLLERSRR